jgi:hypothetical protein
MWMCSSDGKRIIPPQWEILRRNNIFASIDQNFPSLWSKKKKKEKKKQVSVSILKVKHFHLCTNKHVIWVVKFLCYIHFFESHGDATVD